MTHSGLSWPNFTDPSVQSPWAQQPDRADCYNEYTPASIGSGMKRFPAPSGVKLHNEQQLIIYQFSERLH